MFLLPGINCGYFLMKIFSITCGSDSVSHWIKAYLGILFQSFTFVETSIVERVDLLVGLK